MTITAGPLDLQSLVAKSDQPLQVIDPRLEQQLEDQAKALAEGRSTLALARALVLVADQLTLTWDKYTAETKSRSEEVAALQATISQTNGAAPSDPASAPPSGLTLTNIERIDAMIADLDQEAAAFGGNQGISKAREHLIQAKGWIS